MIYFTKIKGKNKFQVKQMKVNNLYLIKYLRKTKQKKRKLVKKRK